MSNGEIFDSAVVDFVVNIGVAPSVYDGNGVLQLALEYGGVFGLERGEFGVVAYLSREHTQVSATMLERALQEAERWPIENEEVLHVGINEDGYLNFILRIPPNTIAVHSIFRALNSLAQLQDMIGEENNS